MENTDESGPQAPGPRTEPVPAIAIADRLAALDQRMAELDERARHRETVIDRLHAENQELRAGERRSALDPVITDLIGLHEQLVCEAARLRSEDLSRTSVLLESLADDVLLALERVGVVPLEARPGDPFLSELHRPLAAVDGPDPALAGTVASVAAQGFRDAATGRVRRRVRARFHRYATPARVLPEIAAEHLPSETAPGHVTPEIPAETLQEGALSRKAP